MNIYGISPTATTFLADGYERWGHHGCHPWFLVARLVFLVLVIAGIWLIVWARRGLHGIRTLRDAYAKGEVNEAEYRQRLAVLKESPPLVTPPPRGRRYAFRFTGRGCDTLSWLHAGCGAAW